MKFKDKFRLGVEKEDFQKIYETIESGIEFKGTNLWILIFAIFIASLGLNVNSTAVIIGAMLVSPLMGPIMGLGFCMAINDAQLLRKSIFSYLLAAGVGLTTSTLYFLISPISEAHSEILSRTSPNIYDVLIALFGGLAGMVAVSSKLKGNVIPGVAIATALMPPLCTAGYGLATLNPEFFFGASYLFLINSVFIAIATLITARILKYPFKQFPDKAVETNAKRIVYAVALITILPSIYFGYDMVQQSRFLTRAHSFVDNEANFPNDYLLKKTIDAEKKIINLVYGGNIISTADIEKLKSKLVRYDLQHASLTVQQGFAFLPNNQVESQMAKALREKEDKITALQMRLDSLATSYELSKQVFNELRIQFPNVQSLILQRANKVSADGQKLILLCNISSTSTVNQKDKTRIVRWLKVRLQSDDLQVSITP